MVHLTLTEQEYSQLRILAAAGVAALQAQRSMVQRSQAQVQPAPAPIQVIPPVGMRVGNSIVTGLDSHGFLTFETIESQRVTAESVRQAQDWYKQQEQQAGLW